MYKTILLAHDGSDHADAALDAALGQAAAPDATIRIVTVAQPVIDPVIIGYTTVPIPMAREDLEKIGAELLAKVMAKVPDAMKGRVATKLLFGDPAHAIVDEAATTGADLIVLGRRGLGRLSGLLIGSTSSKVAQLAPCAVLTVK